MRSIQASIRDFKRRLAMGLEESSFPLPVIVKTLPDGSVVQIDGSPVPPGAFTIGVREREIEPDTSAAHDDGAQETP